MVSDRHSLLARQIRRFFGDADAVPNGDWRAFLDAVNQAYLQSDADRALLERSMDLSSQELIQSERNFRNSLSLLQATLDSTTDGILVVDRAGRIAVSNRRFAEMWRVPEDLLQAGDDEQLIAFVLDQLEHPEAFVAKIRDLYSHPEAESQDILEFRDGRVFERSSLPQRIGGECVGRVWSFRDVTERRRAEEERARLQIMGALGHLVGSLAHEVRNPLFAISATLEAVMKELEDARYEPLRRPLQYLREPTARLGELMSELLEYGKPLGQNLTEGSLQGVARQAVEDCGALAAERKVEVRVRLGETDPRVGMIPHRLLMAQANLIQNAIQHTPGGKTVLVEVDEFEAEDGAWARFRVEDSGTGFDQEDLPRIFEPFFTRRRGGTGLGLSIVQRVAEEHRARLVAGNRPEGGAVVTLDLPRWPPRSGSA